MIKWQLHCEKQQSLFDHLFLHFSTYCLYPSPASPLAAPPPPGSKESDGCPSTMTASCRLCSGKGLISPFTSAGLVSVSWNVFTAAAGLVEDFRTFVWCNCWKWSGWWENDTRKLDPGLHIAIILKIRKSTCYFHHYCLINSSINGQNGPFSKAQKSHLHTARDT